MRSDLWSFRVDIIGSKPVDAAQVCAGGIPVCEVEQETLESKLAPGVYFAGEVLDVDGICGGYNLQWAWSSGYVSGVHAADAARERKGTIAFMIRMNQIKLPIGHTDSWHRKYVNCSISRSSKSDIPLAQRSIDARKKPNLQYVYTVDVTVASEAALQKKIRDKNMSFFTPKQYVLPKA